MSTQILGIRHHGPGSARNVKEFLELTRPDIVLVEGPPDAEGILQWMNHEEMKPPVAILVYQPENLTRSVFYPFAEFSPEWQAILYAKQNNIHVRFMDLPMAHTFALKQEEESWKEGVPAENEIANLVSDTESEELMEYKDPVSYLAEAAGHNKGEKWWDHFVEHRQGNEAIFEAVAEAMQSLRDELPPRREKEDTLREAWMRKTIRQAEKEMFQNIAVICGAWHVPALTNMPGQKEDNELLKGLPKVKVECTWIPWSYNRLSYFSGYGAGIESPGWYEHIWNHPNDDGTRWMAGVAKLFRKQGMDTSVAHVIEAVRLAESLASLRNLSKAGLEELNEATLSVLCNGESIMMKLIHDELIVSNKIGQVPIDIPKPPLQADIEKTQKRLRLQPIAEFKDYQLDLRTENDLDRSIFMHRLQLLEIQWGRKYATAGKGTFKENWRLQWEPSLSIEIIEKGIWGNTVEAAAGRFAGSKASASASLKEVTDLLEETIPAELPQTVQTIIHCINNLAASSGDVMQLMDAVPGLVSVTRYGNVRKTDTGMVLDIARNIITRICVSLPAACISVNDDAAQVLLGLFSKMNDALNLLQEKNCMAEWRQVLLAVAQNKLTAPVLSGYATRLLSDCKLLVGEDLIQKFSYAMSSGNAHAIVSAWLEGFLRGSGTILLLDDELWGVIDNWVALLDELSFTDALPVLRRTFAGFTTAERKKLGEKAKNTAIGKGSEVVEQMSDNFDYEAAKRGLPVIMKLLKLG